MLGKQSLIKARQCKEWGRCVYADMKKHLRYMKWETHLRNSMWSVILFLQGQNIFLTLY
jgi:hypothetical protein